jgi:hypothetical protein
LGLAGGTGAGIRGAGAGADGPLAGVQDALASARQPAKTLIVEAFISRM